jgi:hypothetical protein
MDYRNIFNYYRGQTKKENGIDIGTRQIENNVKKAFINVLEHSNELLTLNFIRKFIDPKNESHTFDYLYEVGRKLKKTTARALVVGIAETKDLSETISEKDLKTRPDGAILTDSISILIETKTGTDQLFVPQLKGHKNTFAKGQLVEDQPVLILWKEIKEFFSIQLEYFKSTNDMKTSFLLEQFEQFCNDNSVGFPSKSKEYFFSLFKTQKARELAKEIDEYICNKSQFKDEIEDYHDRYKEGIRTDCIGYISKKGSYKFASMTMARNVCFALQLGKKLHTERAKEMQKEIDALLNHKYEDTDQNFTAGEAYIRLEWVDNVEQIKPFIDEAYHLRLKR